MSARDDGAARDASCLSRREPSVPPRDASRSRKTSSIFSIQRFITFFLAITVVAVGSVLLMLRMLLISRGNLPMAIGIVVANACFMSLILLVLETVWHRIVIQRPINRILEGLARIEHGDFSARIEPSPPVLLKLGVDHRPNEFDLIIRTINHMAEELGSVESLRDDFVSSVSHELKSPLASIVNYATLLSDPMVEASRCAEYAREISASSKRLSELVTNILRLNRLDNHAVELRHEVFDLAEELRVCFLPFAGACEGKHLEAEINLLERTFIETDRELTSIIWSNLISNAVKFSDEGGRILIALSADGSHAHVVIADNGCGMDELTRRHMFDKFFQGDTSHAVQGNGLGLALVRRVADLAGFELSVSSEPGVGTAFTVEIPLASRAGVTWPL